MKPEHRKYIQQYFGTKTVQEIARDLGIRERNVQKYIEARGLRSAKAAAPVARQSEGEALPSYPRWLSPALSIMLFALTLFVYANALKNGFVWDDEFLIRDNVYIRSFSHFFDIFKSYLACSSGNINNFYRPLQDLSLMVDYYLWGGWNNPFGYHLTNVILHALAAIGVFFLTKRIMKDIVAAFIAASIFAVHPINTEAVTYVAGRADPLFLVFFTLSFIFFLKGADDLKGKAVPAMAAGALAAGCYALTILSKEIGIILPVYLIVYILCFRRSSAERARLLIRCIPFALIAVAYIIARKTVLDFSFVAPSFLMAKFNIIIRLLTTFKAICVYLGLLVMPAGLHMERVIGIAGGLFEPLAVGAMFVVGALAAAVIWSRRYSEKIFFAGLWFFIGLIPVSNIVPINSFIAEHWLYLPAIGFYMMAGLAGSALFYKDKGAPFSIIWKAFTGFLLILLVLFYGFLTIERNKDWKDEISFFKNTLKYAPTNTRLHLNFGNTYYEQGDIDNALKEYQIAIELNPNYAEAYSNIGSIYLRRGNYAEAKVEIEKALKLKPDFPQALSMAGLLAEMEGNYPKAEEHYLAAIKIMPDFINCHMRLAEIYAATNRIDKAANHWRQVLAINPKNQEAAALLKKYGL